MLMEMTNDFFDDEEEDFEDDFEDEFEDDFDDEDDEFDDDDFDEDEDEDEDVDEGEVVKAEEPEDAEATPETPAEAPAEDAAAAAAAATPVAAQAVPEEEKLSATTPGEIPLSVVVEVGRLRMSMQTLMDLKPGNLVELDVMPESGIDLVVNGSRVAKGELLQVGDNLGIRILELG